MSEVIVNFFKALSEAYSTMMSSFPNWLQISINLLLLTMILLIYCILIWKIHKSMSTKNILKINLHRFNVSENKFIFKFMTGFFYFLENLIIFPFLILLWYAIFTIFLISLAETADVSIVLIISTVVLASIRATAYYKETLSRDLAKLLPFTLLAVYLFEFSTFNFQGFLSNLSQLPSLFQNILVYLIFLYAFEIILRFVDLIFGGFYSESEKED